jgi:DNA damage-binding protein 1
MAYTYIASTHKSTAVNHSILCNFTSPEDINLILIKNNYIEVKLVTPDGLQNVLTSSIYGRITALDFYRPANSQQDVLFLLTEQKQFCILGYDAISKVIISRAKGNVCDKVGKDISGDCKGMIDPEYRAIAMHLYDGHLKVCSCPFILQ